MLSEANNEEMEGTLQSSVMFDQAFPNNNTQRQKRITSWKSHVNLEQELFEESDKQANTVTKPLFQRELEETEQVFHSYRNNKQQALNYEKKTNKNIKEIVVWNVDEKHSTTQENAEPVDPHVTLNKYLLTVLKVTRQDNVSEITQLSKEFIETAEKTIDNLIDRFGKVQQQTIVNNNNSNCNLFQSFIQPIAEIEGEMITMNQSFSALSLLGETLSSRSSCSEANRSIERFRIDLFFNEKLYHLMKTVKDVEYSMLSCVQKRLLDRMLRDFERNGLGRCDASLLKRISKLKKQISKLSIKYNTNLVEAEPEILEFSPKDLDGVSESYLDALPRKELGNGKFNYLVCMKSSDYATLMKCAKSEQVRKLANISSLSKCKDLNASLFEKVISLRNQVAKLLGYKSHADYILEIRMAKNVETVKQFLGEIKEKIEPLAKKEMDELLNLKEEFCKENNIEFDGKINSWDISFFTGQLSNHLTKANQIKNYLPFEPTLKKILKLFGNLYSVEIREDSDKVKDIVWDSSVRFFSVYDNKRGSGVTGKTKQQRLLGHFFMDVFQRKGKYHSNACFPIQCRFVKSNDNCQLPVCCIVAQFTHKSSGESTHLLKVTELKTLLHEFGHCFHNMCTLSPYARFSGTSVEKDCAELPSQFQENWIWDEFTLNLLAGHYETKEKVPKDIVEELKQSRILGIGLQTLQRVHLAMFDILVHDDYLSKNPNNTCFDLYKQLKEEITMIQLPEGVNPCASFGHLFRNYDSGFYSYLYSQVFSCDIFNYFKENNSLNSKTNVSELYREIILERGGTVDGMDMLVQFLGRKPSTNAFFSSIGVNYNQCKINNSL
ncbi:hypothetical protein ABK040_006894 [Willaertia magna]